MEEKQKHDLKEEEKKQGENKAEETVKVEKRKEEAKPEAKKKEKKPVVKKDEAVACGKEKISTKQAMAICKFIKGKTCDEAVKDLEAVVKMKKAIPFKASVEMPHRKGKMMAGRYPVKASAYFIKLIKTLKANGIVNGIENGKIVFACPNPAGKIHRRNWRKFKHTSITLKLK